MPNRWASPNLWGLAVIIGFYLLTGMAYAWLTPSWETPDEPAHYNYVSHLVKYRSLPVLQQSDYDYDYLERIKAAKFPLEMSIDPIRYEFHQPPLYYLLGATLVAPLPESWWPMTLRLLSVILGAVLLVVAYLVGIEIFPRRPLWALGATAFVAVVPMHVAMTAAINNDTLAELIIGLILLVLVRRVARDPGSHSTGRDLLLGVLMGLGLITKTTTYITFPLVLAVTLAPSVWGLCKEPNLKARALPWKQTLPSAARAFGIALLMGLFWFVRNSQVYGGVDILGLGRHDAIMLQQPHTADWLARLGWVGLAKEFLVTTFRSFWAQFGWMGILVDERIYLVLGLMSCLVVLGFVMFLLRDFGRLLIHQKLCLAVLSLSFLLTLVSYLWYNTQFVQHQGRYLFPALIPLGIFFALGVWTLLDRSYAKYLAGLLVLGMLVAGAKGWLTGHINHLLIAMLGGMAALFSLRTFLPQTWRKGLYVLPFLVLWALDVVCLLVFIVPYFKD